MSWRTRAVTYHGRKVHLADTRESKTLCRRRVAVRLYSQDGDSRPVTCAQCLRSHLRTVAWQAAVVRGEL